MPDDQTKYNDYKSSKHLFLYRGYLYLTERKSGITVLPTKFREHFAFRLDPLRRIALCCSDQIRNEMVLAHRNQKMDVVRSSACLQQFAIKAFYDPADVSVQLVLDLRLDEGIPILRRKDDMKKAAE